MDAEDLYEEDASGYKFHWLLIVIRLLALVASVFGIFGRLFGGIAEDLTQHLNYKTERDAFQAEARRELETLTEAPEEG